MRLFRPLSLAILLVLVTGCSVAPVATTTGPSPSPTPNDRALTGKVHGGQSQQPISGAQIYLLAVASGSSGTLSDSIMKGGAGTDTSTGGLNSWNYVSTHADGTFAISAADYACTTGQIVYLYSYGGNPGLGGNQNNTAAGLMALLGRCTAPGTFSGVQTGVQLDEVTTVAAAYALAGFATTSTEMAASASTPASSLNNAAATAADLANLATGVSPAKTPGGTGTVPVYEINTLADILAACVNTSGPGAGGCTSVLPLAKDSGGNTPSDTATAAINIAHHPSANVANLWAQRNATAPYQPELSAAPNDWTVAITYSGGGTGLNQPYGIAVDANGYIWAANQGGTNLTKLDWLGNAQSIAGSLSAPKGIAVDSSNNVWVANSGNNTVGEYNGSSFSSPSGGSPNAPSGIAIDPSNDVWIANGNNSISEFVSGTGTNYTGGGLNSPLGIASDAFGNAWVADNGGAAISEFNASGAISGSSGYTGASLNHAAGIAIDSTNTVWVTNQTGNSISTFTNAGAAGNNYTGGGLNGPTGIAIDGSGNVWVANYGGGTGSNISEYIPATGFITTTNGGYQAESSDGTTNPLKGPMGIAVDGSGNVWVTNNGSGANSITEFVGAATPAAATPLATQPFNLAIGTSALPTGTVGTPYTATLQAGGGTQPYSWAQTGGLALSTWNLTLASNGTISGTPEATAAAVSLSFTVTDAKNAHQSVTLNLTINGNSNVTVTAISPQNGGITIHQTLPVSATTSDGTSVTWSATAGTFSTPSSASGAAVTYTPPATAGAYTITATSNSSGATLTSRVGVTDLTGVWTYHNNNYRDGANTHEYALTPTNVTSDFGLLFRCAVDSPIYTQPLWVPNLTINGAAHNVVFVATTNDTLYAFDADAAPCTTLWSLSMLGTSELPVPSGTTGHLVGNGNGDIQPKTGIIGTPVIDLSTNTLYVVSKSYKTSPQTFYQRLHAVDLASGAEKFNGPVALDSAHIPYNQCNGTGCTPPAFNQKLENQRCALALANGTVYVSWAGHEDAGTYYGWIAGFSAGDLSQTPTVFNDAPDAQASGIWLSGGAPAIDDSGNLYLTTGNGTLDAYSGTAPNDDYGNAAMKLSASLGVVSSFASPAHSTGFSADLDLGAGGITIVPNGANPPLLINGGKDNFLYVLNSSSLGGYNDAAAQEINLGDQVFGTGAFWNSTYYLGSQDHVLQAFTLSSGTLNTTTTTTQNLFKFPSTSPSVSSAGSDTTTGILWAQDNSAYCTKNTTNGCGPTVLYAYTATTLGTAIWNSGKTGANAAGNAMKFTVPTVANGKVYVSTRGVGAAGSAAGANDTTVGELDVFGLLH